MLNKFYFVTNLTIKAIEWMYDKTNSFHVPVVNKN